MYVRSIIAAAALSLSSLAASAATINPGDSVDVLASAYNFQETFDNGTAGGVYDFVFNNTSATSVAVTIAFATVKQLGSIAYFVGGVTTEFLGGSSRFTAQGVLDAFTISTVIAAGGSDTLRVTFGDVVTSFGAQTDIDFTVVASAVPVPAGLLLLGTALGGLGFARRRKMAA